MLIAFFEAVGRALAHSWTRTAAVVVVETSALFLVLGDCASNLKIQLR